MPAYVRRTRKVEGLARIPPAVSVFVTARVHKDTHARLQKLARRLGLKPAGFVRIEIEAAIARLEMMLPPGLGVDADGTLPPAAPSKAA